MAALLGLLLAAAQPARAQCPPDPGTTDVTVTLRQPKVLLHHDLTAAGLAKLRRGAGQPVNGWIVSGFAASPDPVYMSMAWTNFGLPDGRDCIYPRDVKIVLGDAQVNIFIAADYPDGSCEYNALLVLEDAEAVLYTDTLRDWRAPIVEAMRQAITTKFPLIVPGLPDRQVVSNYLRSTIRTATDQLDRDLAMREALVNTPAARRRREAQYQDWHRDGIGEIE